MGSSQKKRARCYPPIHAKQCEWCKRKNLSRHDRYCPQHKKESLRMDALARPWNCRARERRKRETKKYMELEYQKALTCSKLIALTPPPIIFEPKPHRPGRPKKTSTPSPDAKTVAA